jgi:predicted nucleotidyltransferase
LGTGSDKLKGTVMTREDAIREATGILARCYAPERIYLVGSSARGEARTGSDLDFVIVLPDNAPSELLLGAGVQRQLWEIPFGVDIVPFRRSTFEKRSEWLMSLPAIALREGRLVYAAGKQAA